MFQVLSFHCEHFRLISYAVGTEKPSPGTEIPSFATLPTKENNSNGNVNTVLISSVLALVGLIMIVLVWIAICRRSHNEDGNRDASSKQPTNEDDGHGASIDRPVEEEEGGEASTERPTGNDEDVRGGAAMEQRQDQGGGASTIENSVDQGGGASTTKNLVFELMAMHEDGNQANRAGNATEPGSVLIITSTIYAH